MFLQKPRVIRSYWAGVLTVAVLFTVILFWTSSLGLQASKDNSPNAEPRVLAFDVRLDKQEASPGTSVRCTETIRADRELIVAGRGHVVYRIGDYDRKLGEITIREKERFLLE